MITPEHLRAADEAAIASMDPSQRRAMDNLLRANSPVLSTAEVVERRRDGLYRRQAAATNAELARLMPA